MIHSENYRDTVVEIMGMDITQVYRSTLLHAVGKAIGIEKHKTWWTPEIKVFAKKCGMDCRSADYKALRYGFFNGLDAKRNLHFEPRYVAPCRYKEPI